ncbi:hypothetical protein QR680_017602 [Steinernema hermaphroditum]|uniref:Uncharacterized protein n=1 Tax=Steinernema hermaphroditum TaxID=289476 RepID=A0AA39HF69_9BILA|nr:hypothetical protein QR680_017602 [Steinernema hermaphroditum]
MMGDLVTKEDALPEEVIVFWKGLSANAEALEAIVDWMRMYEEQEPHSEEIRQIHRFNRNVTKEDTELLDHHPLDVERALSDASSPSLLSLMQIIAFELALLTMFSQNFVKTLTGILFFLQA